MRLTFKWKSGRTKFIQFCLYMELSAYDCGLVPAFVITIPSSLPNKASSIALSYRYVEETLIAIVQLLGHIVSISGRSPDRISAKKLESW